MKKITSSKSTMCIILAVLTLISCTTPKPDDREDNSFLTTLDIHLDAIKDGNLEQLEPTVADSVIMISPFGDRMDSKAVFMDFHKNWFTIKNSKWEGEVVRTQRTDSMGYALIQYEYSQQDSLGATLFKSHAYLILIFKNSKAGWQLIHDQNTSIQNQKK
jgi:hypothetical protein